MKKKSLAIIGATSLAGIAAAGAIGAISNYFYDIALDRDPKKRTDFYKRFTSDTEKKHEEVSKEIHKLEEVYIGWFENESNYKDVYIDSYDGLKLHGCEVIANKESHKWVITIHGYAGNCKDMSYLVQKFKESDYNVLTPNLRGHGKSEGKYIGMGWHDRKDILKWIDYILEKDKNAEIVLYGISMGAGTVMMTVGEELVPNVKAAIEDCGYTSAWEEFGYQIEMFNQKVLKRPVLTVADIITKVRAGYRLREASAIKQLENSKIPMLFIHGDEDKFVPYYMLDKLYEAAKCPKEKLVVHGAGHAQSIVLEPELYWEKVSSFLEQYVDNKSAEEDLVVNEEMILNVVGE